MSYENSCWPVPMDGVGRKRKHRVRHRSGMGDIPSSSFSIESASGVAVANDSATKGVFLDLQNQLNRMLAKGGFGVIKADGIIGNNTLNAVLNVCTTFGLLPGGEACNSWDIPTVAGQADVIASYLESMAVGLAAPAVSPPAASPAGGGSGSSPAPASAVAKNAAIPTPDTITIPILNIAVPTMALAAAGGLLAFLLISKSKKRGGGRRPRAGARARRRPARRRSRGRRRR